MHLATLERPPWAASVRDYQYDGLTAIRSSLLAGKWSQVCVLPTGCHAAGQGILMGDGSIQMVEDVLPGDVLAAPDGDKRTVLRLARGVGQMVRIVPVKGDPWVVNLDHILTLERTRERTGNRSGYPSTEGGQIVDVSVRDWLTWSKYKRHVFKLARRPANFQEQPVELDPYILGLLLGDGWLSKNETMGYATEDPETLAEISRFANVNGLRLQQSPHPRTATYTFRSLVKWERSPLTAVMRRLGLLPIRSENRFVPAQYKRNSEQVRLGVLAGLIDSDGSQSRAGFDFSSISSCLAADVAFLARSLGLAAYITKRQTKSQRGTSCDSFRVSISGDCSIVPCRIPRKKAPPRRNIKDVLRTGFTVEHAGVDSYYGFELDGDGRYMLDDFTVTHNSGKTHLFAHLPIVLEDWLAQFRQRRMLILAHREELLDQSAAQLRAINPHLMVGVEQAGRRTGPMHDVVIASVQTLAAAGGRRLDGIDPDSIRIAVVDEAHHSPAVSYQRVLGALGVIPPDDIRPIKRVSPAEYIQARHACQQWWTATPADRLLLGVTATPHRSDGVGLEWSFQSITFEKSLRWMIDRQYLVQPHGLLIETSTNLDNVHTVAGDFNQGELADTVNTPERNDLTVQGWQAKAVTADGRPMKTVGFTVDIQHARDLCDAFQAAGVNAAWASGEHREAVARFKAGQVDVLLSCNLVTEGFDYPPAACALMARPTKSHTLYMQMVGRVLRTFEGKPKALILDVVDVASRHSLVTIGDLFGLPAKFDAKGKSVSEAATIVDALLKEAPGARIGDARTLEDIERRVRQIDLWSVQKSEAVEANATMAWVEVAPSRFRLSLPGVTSAHDTLDLSVDLLGAWTAAYHTDTAVNTIATADSMPAIFAVAEQWVTQLAPHITKLVAKDAAWRGREASEAQITLLRKLRAPGDLSKLSRGEASTLLDRYFAQKPRRRA